jgi:hypothetical protein
MSILDRFSFLTRRRLHHEAEIEGQKIKFHVADVKSASRLIDALPEIADSLIALSESTQKAVSLDRQMVQGGNMFVREFEAATADQMIHRGRERQRAMKNLATQLSNTATQVSLGSFVLSSMMEDGETIPSDEAVAEFVSKIAVDHFVTLLEHAMKANEVAFAPFLKRLRQAGEQEEVDPGSLDPGSMPQPKPEGTGNSGSSNSSKEDSAPTGSSGSTSSRSARSPSPAGKSADTPGATFLAI